MSLLSRTLLTLLLSAAPMLAGEVPAGPLIANSDFENDVKNSGWPDGWAHPKEGITWESEGGNHFLRFSSTDPAKTVMLYQPVTLPAGVRALELSWRQRVTDLKLGKQPWFDARIMLEFKDAKGQKLPGAPGAPNTRKNEPAWTAHSMKFLVPEGAHLLELMPVLFQVEHGTFDLDDLVVRPTDPAPVLAAAEAKAAQAKKTFVAPESPQPAKWPSPLHVEGNKLLNREGKNVWLQGVNIVSLEWNPAGEQIQRSALVSIEQWKANILRLPVKESYWFGREGRDDGGKAYRDLVDSVITLAANRGAYVLLDLHRFRAPQAEHADFWKDAAARYKSNPAVLFDLFNEPHDTSWEVWRNGGFVEEKKKPADEDAFTAPGEKAKAATGFQAIGMQALVKAVRDTGAPNIIVAGGLDWAYDLSGIVKGFALSDSALVYSTHIYPWKKGWAEKVLPVAEKYPVLVGELGANTRKMEFIPASGQEDAATWVPAMLGFLQKYHLHWTAFSMHPKSSPVLITDWNYTPTEEWGTPVKEALSGKLFPLDRLR